MLLRVAVLIGLRTFSFDAARFEPVTNFDVFPGETYKLSFYYKTNKGVVGVMWFYDTNGQSVGVDHTGVLTSAKWTKGKLTMAAPANASYVDVYFTRAGGTEVVCGCVDAVRLIKKQ